MTVAGSRVIYGLAVLVMAIGVLSSYAQEVVETEGIPEGLRASVEAAVAKVKPALVRIEVVWTDYSDGREVKYQATGSGVIISKEGHVITNHHVAGHAKRLLCTLASKEEIEAEVIGKDPPTDIAVIKLLPEDSREFPTASFGDSSQVKVGDYVLAMGSPLSLSQSVTLGIISNVELVMPEWLGSWRALEQDGEDVGSLVRWIGHDAEIYGGNSGGPLVNLQGEIVGINEIRIGLGGAIPGDLAERVAETLIAQGRVKRAWLGLAVQPRLKHSPHKVGALISSVLDGAPAAQAGFEAGDLLVRVGGHEVDVQFLEQLPIFNQLVADLSIGQPVEAIVRRGDQELTLSVAPIEREEALPPEQELKPWGVTARNMSYLLAKELKRDSVEGVLVTSVRPGGPAGDSKPPIQRNDVVVVVNEKPVKNLEELKVITEEITADQKDPVPTLVAYERGAERYMTVVKVGVKELEDPGLEVKKAWLPVKTQVLTRDIAEELGSSDLTGFRITQVFKGSAAEKAGLQVGDFILALDSEKLTANAPEDYDDLPQLIRQYKVGSIAQFTILRGQEQLTIPVELGHAPKLNREMKRYRDENFEFTVRDISFFDKAEKKWPDDQKGAIVEEVESGGWGNVGLLEAGDLILAVDGQPVADVDSLESIMDQVEAAKPKATVFKVLRGIYTMYLEFEPKWEPAETGKG